MNRKYDYKNVEKIGSRNQFHNYSALSSPT